MSTLPKRSDRLLVAATAALMLVAVLVCVWGLMRLDTKKQKIAERSLETAQQLMRVRISGMIYEVEKQLRQEAASLMVGSGREDDAQRLRRWETLLGSHWLISKVVLSDEHGNETALLRTSEGPRLRATEAGVRVNSPLLPGYVQLADDGSDTLDSDPRTELWYSKALEDVRNEPAWTLVPNDKVERTRLQLAMLLRSPDANGPFRVLMFEMLPAQGNWLLNPTTPMEDYGFLVMDNEGHVLNSFTDSKNKVLQGAMDVALRLWTKERPSYELQVPHLDRNFAALLSPYALNGETFFTGVILDLRTTDAIVRPERRALVLMLSLLIVLSIVLIMLWLMRRASIRRVRAQERYSRSQEIQLAKAIGEREVLNREVHHRVKNNLQVVSSLLNLQASDLADGPLRDEFLRGKRRIDSIALVHHKLYALKDLRSVDLDTFITTLTEALSKLYEPASRTVICDVRAHRIRIDQDTAIGLGIILCELVANAYQHAFPYATGGHIDIAIVNVEGDLYRMVMSDNGVGVDTKDLTGSGKLGMEIVEAMADQLDGSFHVRSGMGSTFEVLFRVKPTVVAAATDMFDSM